MSETHSGARNVEIAFEGIRAAAILLSPFPYAEAVKRLREQVNASFYTDPTLVKEMDNEDLKRKIRLLEAAAHFVSEFDAVRDEALAALEKGDKL